MNTPTGRIDDVSPMNSGLPAVPGWPARTPTTRATSAAEDLLHAIATDASFRALVAADVGARSPSGPSRRPTTRSVPHCSNTRSRMWSRGRVTGNSPERSARRRAAHAAPGRRSRAWRIAAEGTCLLLHAEETEELEDVSEATVLDDFEAFAYSHHSPYACPTVVGRASYYVYSVHLAQHRRGDHLTPYQRRIRAAIRRRYGRVPRGEVGRGVRQTLDMLLRRALGRLHIISDGERTYRRVVDRHPQRDRIDQEIHPDPPRGPRGATRSVAARARDEAMFAVDQLHILMRRSEAHRRREAVAFARRHNDPVSREFVLVIWRNFVKQRSKRRPTERRPRCGSASWSAGGSGKRCSRADAFRTERRSKDAG